MCVKERVPGRGGDARSVLQPSGDDEPHDLLLAAPCGAGEERDVLMLIGLDDIEQRKSVELRRDPSQQRAESGGIIERRG